MNDKFCMTLTYKFDDESDKEFKYDVEVSFSDIIEYLLTEIVPAEHQQPGCYRIIEDLYKAGIVERDLNDLYDDDNFIEWLHEYWRDSAYEAWKDKYDNEFDYEGYKADYEYECWRDEQAALEDN